MNFSNERGISQFSGFNQVKPTQNISKWRCSSFLPFALPLQCPLQLNPINKPQYYVPRAKLIQTVINSRKSWVHNFILFDQNVYINSLIDFVFEPNSYETSDGVSRQEQAELKNAGSENEAIAVRGSISWIAPDGQTYTLNYIADENGFQPEGEHLPKA